MKKDKLQSSLLWTVLIFSLSGVSGQDVYADYDWSGALDTFFDALTHSTIPAAIAPLVTIAENADELDLDGLTIALSERRKELHLEGTTDPLNKLIDKKINAIERMISKTRGLKDKINPPHKEQGWDPFYGVMHAGGPISKPTVGSFVSASLSLDLSDTNPDYQPASYMVLPGVSGVTELTVHPTAATANVNIHNDDGSGRYRLELVSFSYTLPSFDLGGAETGTNTMLMTTDLGHPLGDVTFPSGSEHGGLFNLRFGVKMTNDLYGPSKPLGPAIPVFVQARGSVDFDTGRSVVSAEDPFLIPGIPGLEQGYPMFAAPIMAVFEAATDTIQFKDMFFDAEAGLDSGLAPKIVFFRSTDNSYGTMDNSLDRILGASLAIEDLHIATVSDTMVTFDPSLLTIEDQDDMSLLNVSLSDITLNVLTGDFYANLDLDGAGFFADTTGSPFLAQYLDGEPLLQLLSPQVAGELYLATNHFVSDGQISMVDFVNGIPEPSTVLLLGLGSMVLLRRRRKA